MIQPNHADFANDILAEIAAQTDGNTNWGSHRDSLFSELTYRRLLKDAKKIKDPSMSLAIQALLVLNYNMDVDESICLFERSVALNGYDNSWGNMMDALQVRGFFSHSAALAKRALESYRTDTILNHCANIGLVVHDLELLSEVNRIYSSGHYTGHMEAVMSSFAYTPAAIELSKKLDCNPVEQSRALVQILDFIATKNVCVKRVKTFNDKFFDALPVEIVVNAQSKENILKINDELIDFMISRDFDFLMMSVSVTGDF